MSTNAVRHEKRWDRGSIASLLRNRAVLGEYTPDKRTKNPGQPRMIYPRVISDDLFYEVQRALDTRRHQGGRKGINNANLFGHRLMRYAYCNSTVHYDNKNYHAAKRDMGIYLVCSNLSCERRRWRYDEFETSFLNHIRELDIDTLSLKDETDPTIAIDRAIASLQGELTHAKSRWEQTYETMEHVTNKQRLAQKLDEIQSDIYRLESAITSKQAEKTAATVSQKVYEASREEYKSLIQKIQRREPNADVYALREKLISRIRSLIDVIYFAPNGDRAPTNIELRDETMFSGKRFFLVKFKNGERVMCSDAEDDFIGSN